MKKVEMPISDRVSTKVFLRPIRAPICENRKSPNGRTKNVSENEINQQQSDDWIAVREEYPVEVEAGDAAIQEIIEPLDRATGQAGNQDLLCFDALPFAEPATTSVESALAAPSPACESVDPARAGATTVRRP